MRPIPRSSVIEFCRKADQSEAYDLSEVLQAGAQSLPNDQAKALIDSVMSLLIDPLQSEWTQDSALEMSTSEILRLAFVATGTLNIGFRGAADYLEALESYREKKISDASLFTRLLSVLMRAQFPLYQAWTLIAVDHPQRSFQGVARDAHALMSTGGSLVGVFEKSSEVVGRDFVEAWRQIEQNGDFVSELEKLR